MKKTALKNLLYGIIAVISAVFFHTHQVRAAEILSQSVIDVATDGTTNTSPAVQQLGDGIMGRLSSVGFWLEVNDTNDGGSVFATLECYDDSLYNNLCNGGVDNYSWTSSSNNVAALSATFYEFDFSSSDFLFDSSKFYKISVKSVDFNNFGGEYLIVYGSDDDDYADGSAQGNEIGTVVDLGFVVSTDGPVFFASPPFTDGMTTTDFTYWRYCVDPAGLTFTDIDVEIQYGAVLTDFDDLVLDNEPDWGDYVKCWTSPKVDDFVLGSALARVNLYLDDVPHSSSEILSFTVVAGAKSTYPIDLGGAENPDLTFECGDGNFLVIGLCKAAVFLFVPGDGSTALANEAYTDLSGTFPFAYVTDVWEAVDGLEEGTASASSLTLDFENTALPLGGTEGIDIFSTETIEGYLGTGQLALFRGLMATAIWVGLGFYVFHRAGGLH